MRCCQDCFADRWIREFIDRRSHTHGRCPSCGSEGKLIEAPELTPYFEPLADSYAVRADGVPLSDAFQVDWKIFANGANPADLVQQILGVGRDTRFSPKESDDGISLATWDDLKAELLSRNRYFPDSAISLDSIKNLVAPQLEKDFSEATYFRARVQAKGETIEPGKMGAPPAERATAGRANPVGIPYLYVASDQATAVSEVKPQKGALIAIASLFAAPGQVLRVIDLVNPRDSITPFLQPSRIPSLRATIPFIEALDVELSTPVQSQEAALDYIASQYICEMFKKAGYQGVRYRSSVGTGQNFAFFEPNVLNMHADLRFLQVSAITVDTVDA